MKIIAPVDRPDEAQALIDAGADELFCGLYWEPWLQTYTIAAVNRRSGSIASIESVDALAETVRIAHAAGVPVCLTINEHYYTSVQYPLLFEYIGCALDTGVDSLIVADPALVLGIRAARLNAELHLSTGTAIFNSEAAAFFRDLGVSRVTLERQQTIEEVGSVVRNLDGMETAVFVLNGRCPNVDGLCTYDHVQIPGEAFKNACMLPCQVRCQSAGTAARRKRDADYRHVSPVVRQRVWERYHMDQSPCGACALYDLARLGVTHVKVVGRGNPTARKLADVRFIRAMLTLSTDRTIDRNRFRDAARLLHAHTYRQPCRSATCYYPEAIAARPKVA
ncbi:U32 family peptidase [Candidatus Binatia bacterium]|nr:U32 family peptidase [Candidatus Binatia bacterium]